MRWTLSQETISNSITNLNLIKGNTIMSKIETLIAREAKLKSEALGLQSLLEAYSEDGKASLIVGEVRVSFEQKDEPTLDKIIRLIDDEHTRIVKEHDIAATQLAAVEALVS